MTYDEAVSKAQKPQASNGQADVYAIPFTWHSAVMDLVGKTLASPDPKNVNTMTVVEVIGQNYVLQVNGGDYQVTPVMWALQQIGAGRIVIRP